MDTEVDCGPVEVDHTVDSLAGGIVIEQPRLGRTLSREEISRETPAEEESLVEAAQLSYSEGELVYRHRGPERGKRLEMRQVD